MPNWCTNSVTFKNNDPELVTQLVNAYENGNLFETFMPFPNGEWDYGWCVENWGTKWDISNNNNLVEHEPGYATVVFDTAWSPPTKFYDFMVENGWGVSATYEGEGIQFVGLYEDGDDDYHDVQWNVDWIKNHIPDYIIDEFDLTERIEEELEWQKENEEDEEAVVEESQDTKEG